MIEDLFVWNGLTLCRCSSRLLAATNDLNRNSLVIIVGWLGSKLYDVLKYARIYSEMGHTVLVFIPPISWVFEAALFSILRTSYRKLFECLSTLIDDQYPFHSIVLHLFSNGGAFFYEYLLAYREIESPLTAFELNILATIFDSAPTDVTNTAIRNALGGMKSSIGSWLSQSFFSLYSEIFGHDELEYQHICKMFDCRDDDRVKLFYELIRCSKGPLQRRRLEFIFRIMNDRYPISRLYLFSKSDDVAHWDVIRMTIKELNSFSWNVSYDFGDSAHVDHFRRYFPKYRELIATFLNQVLSGISNSRL